MTSRTRIEAMQRTIERIRRERRAGVGIIAPDSDGGVVLACTAYGRQGETRQQARFDSIDEARAAYDRFVRVHTATEAAPLVIIDI